MAIKAIRVGSLEDINQYDDVDFPVAIQVDGPIDVGAAGAPTNPNEVVRSTDLDTAVAEAITALAVITDHAIVRGAGGARAVQDSLVLIDDAGSISLPAAQTVDGRDVSVDGAKLDGVEALADVTDIAGVNAIIGALAGIANNDLLRWNDPGSTLEAKDIAEVISGQNVSPGNVASSGRISSAVLTVTIANDGAGIDVSGVNIIFIDSSGGAIAIDDFVNGVNGQMLDIVIVDNTAQVTFNDQSAANQQLYMHDQANLVIAAGARGGVSLACNGSDWYDISHAKHV